MKKPKKQKKPSYKSLAFDLARARDKIDDYARDVHNLRNQLSSVGTLNKELRDEIDQARYARENKMKQLGLYFAALDSLPSGHERLIQLQDELFDRTFETPSTNTLYL